MRKRDKFLRGFYVILGTGKKRDGEGQISTWFLRDFGYQKEEGRIFAAFYVLVPCEEGRHYWLNVLYLARLFGFSSLHASRISLVRDRWLAKYGVVPESWLDFNLSLSSGSNLILIMT